MSVAAPARAPRSTNSERHADGERGRGDAPRRGRSSRTAPAGCSGRAASRRRACRRRTSRTPSRRRWSRRARCCSPITTVRKRPRPLAVDRARRLARGRRGATIMTVASAISATKRLEQHRAVADRLAVRSRCAICFDVVPEQTRPWKPEHAPQAIVTKRNGKSAPVGPADVRKPLNAGCSIVEAAEEDADRRRPRAPGRARSRRGSRAAAAAPTPAASDATKQ